MIKSKSNLNQEIQELIKQHSIKIKTELDQHFLADEAAMKTISKALELTKEDILLEIGTGLAITTKQLAKNANKTIVIEIDDQFLPIIKEQLADYNYQLIKKSAYKYLQDLLLEQKKPKVKEQLKIYSNLPFTAVESIFLLLPKLQFKKAVFILPESFYERIIGNIIYEAFFQIKLLDKINKESFYPIPNANSVLIEITPTVKSTDYADFIIKELYLQEDKKVKNALREVIIRFAEKYLQKKATKRETKEILALIIINKELFEKDVPKLSGAEFKLITTELIEHLKNHYDLHNLFSRKNNHKKTNNNINQS